MLPKIAITHGDPNGVGYEVILKALEDPRMLELCTPVIYGSQHLMSQYRKLLGLPNLPMTRINDADDAREGQINIINVVPESFKATPGATSPEAGAAALAALDRAVSDLRSGLTDALVTAPICKSSIQSDGFNFAGHTEYLEYRANEPFDDDDDDESTADMAEDRDRTAESPMKALMILCSDRLRVALVTTHLPLAEIAPAITRQNIIDKLIAFNQALHADFGVTAPRIAVLSLNPHAGDSGLLGREEQEIIGPAITEARDRYRVLAFGPYAADGFFGSGAFDRFDGVLAMYHDQGLAPFKTMAMDAGVNVTAGLDFVRVSPDHGTGFDIAGQGVASAQSMREAIYTAIDILRCRRREHHAHRNPLRRHYHDKGNDNYVLKLD